MVIKLRTNDLRMRKCAQGQAVCRTRPQLRISQCITAVGMPGLAATLTLPSMNLPCPTSATVAARENGSDRGAVKRPRSERRKRGKSKLRNVRNAPHYRLLHNCGGALVLLETAGLPRETMH